MATYKPLWRILAWPPDDYSGAGTEIYATSGEVPHDMFSLVGTAQFSIPRAYGAPPDDYSAAERLVRGAYIKIQVTDDGTFTSPETIYFGNIDTVTADPQTSRDAIYQVIAVDCSDKMQKARGLGVNMSRQTKMLLLDIAFTSADFDSNDPNFLVNIPTDSLTAGYEFVPGMIFALKCEYTRDGEYTVQEYKAGEDYEYGSNSKIIYFKSDQTDQKVDGAWSGSLYYYDPADVDNTAKKLLTAVLTGAPWSHDGGLGFASGVLDLEEIDGFSGEPKVVRSVIRNKTEGPVSQLLDELRESGILPQNYWLRYDYATETVMGSYVYQNDDPSSALVPATEPLDYSHSTTTEGIYGRVECWSRGMNPVNHAPNGTVAINVPTDYTAVLSGADGSEIIDQRPDTVCNFQRTNKSMGSEYEPHKTDVDAWVIDLGEVRPFETIMFRGAQAIDQGWDPPQPHPLIMVTRHAKVTISASLTAIDSNNPGIPISDEALSFEIDSQNTEEWHQFEATLITEARYFAIRFEQDAFARVSDKGITYPTRSSWFGSAEIKILSDGRHRYDKIVAGGVSYDHPDKNQVPYAEIKGADDVATVTAVPNPANQITLSNEALAARLETAGFAQVKAGINDPVIVRITGRTAATITIDPAIAGVAEDDLVGEYNRWMLGWDLAYHDLYYPQLRRKLQNTTDWLEIIDNDDVAEIEDAEYSAVDRLLEGITVTSDHRMEVAYDPNLKVGETVRPFIDMDPWLITKCTYKLNELNSSGDTPPVTQVLEGTNYLEDSE